MQAHRLRPYQLILSLILLMILGIAGRCAAPAFMPPSPHLPPDVVARMRGEDAKKRTARPLRDAGKSTTVNNLASGRMQVLVSGTKQMPCLLINFSDQANTYTTTNFQNLLFVAGGVPTGSARDYYTEVSFGQLTLNGQVSGWYTANNRKQYYGDFRGGNYSTQCAYEAAQKADAAGFNWAPYDNDHDGYVDTLWVVHSGPGAEETGSGKDIWSHSWDFFSAGLGEFTTSTNDPYHAGQKIKINSYIIQPETSYWSGGNGVTQNIVGIGVFCHEFGHALGLPDLYDTGSTNPGEGLGNASLMAGGSWGGNGSDTRYPAHMDAWCKAFLGWTVPTVVTADGAYTVLAAETNQSCFLVKPVGSTVNQYFLIENRQRHGYDNTLFATGLFIYHVDADIIAANSADNTVNVNTHPYGVALEEADATTDNYASMHLFIGSNRGLSTDAWPNGAKNAFSSTSIPSTMANDGTAQNCSITAIPAKSDSMTVTITVGSAANTPPVANTDGYSTAEDTPLVVAAAGVLINDTDANSDPLTAVKVTDPRARRPHAERKRRLYLHAGIELQRGGQLHLQGERRQGRLERRHGEPDDHGGQRCPDGQRPVRDDSGRYADSHHVDRQRYRRQRADVFHRNIIGARRALRHGAGAHLHAGVEL